MRHRGIDMVASRRRGTMYVAVLSVSMLVMVIGLSSLMAIRVENRNILASEDIARARLVARSMFELADARLLSDPAWRTTYTHNVWTSPTMVLGAECAYKLVDDVDDNLANDDLDPFRVFSKATVNEAVRVYSALFTLQPVPNMVKNGDMEAGRAGWQCLSGECVLTRETTNPHGGRACLLAGSRAKAGAGPVQRLSKLANATTYYAEAWVRHDSVTGAARISLIVTNKLGVSLTFSTSGTMAGTGWTKVSGTITPIWVGDLASAELKVASAAMVGLYVDDVVLAKGDGPPESDYAVVPGTWQREPAD